MIVAIDPGVGGGIAWGENSPVCCAGCCAMPESELDIFEVIRDLAPATAFVEDIPKFAGPKLPGSSVAPMFLNFGICRGILMALGIRTILVKPHDWQKHFKLGTRKATGSYAAWKRKLKGEAQRRFPECKPTLATADALLLLDYAKAQPCH